MLERASQLERRGLSRLGECTPSSSLTVDFFKRMLSDCGIFLFFFRNDFYQTATSVNVSLYLKKIDKENAKVNFSSKSIDFDLPTTDNKRFKNTYNLFAEINPEKSQFRMLGTKLELTLAKADGTSWPVLRSDDKWAGERIQIGQAGRA